MQQAADANDIWEMSFLTECCNILPPRCNWFALLPAFCYPQFILLSELLLPPPARKIMWASDGVFTHPCVSVCRCSSKRFSCTFLRRPQALMTTSGWSYKPSLEYVQVCVTVFISLKENSFNSDSLQVINKYWRFDNKAVMEACWTASGTHKPDVLLNTCQLNVFNHIMMVSINSMVIINLSQRI